MIIKKESTKILTLNLVEVTVLFGWTEIEFEKYEDGIINEAAKPRIEKNSLKFASEKKEVEKIETRNYEEY
jgi:Pyruvate/2-oxoacid:ferredoxin oxidoreductase gamma subunit